MGEQERAVWREVLLWCACAEWGAGAAMIADMAAGWYAHIVQHLGASACKEFFTRSGDTG